MKNLFSSWTMFEKVWLVIFFMVLLTISIISQENVISIISTIAGMFSVVLVAKGNIWNYFWGIINVVLYAFIAFSNNYSGEFVLYSFYLLPMQFIGYFMWKKHFTKEEKIVDVKNFTPLMWSGSAIILVVGTYITGQLLPYVNLLFNMEPNPASFVDAFTTFGTIFAMFLMVKRYKEQWLVWILINIFSIILWLKVGNYVLVVMFSAFLVNAIYGFYNWNKEESIQKEL